MSGAGMRRMPTRQHRVDAGGSPPDGTEIIAVETIDGAAVIGVLAEPGPAVVQVSEPVIVGAGDLGVTLDDLVDVEVPDGLPDSAPLVLVRRPADGVFELRREHGADASLSYEHRQTTASSIWLILHPLPFTPAGLIVTSLDGSARLHPQRVSYPAPGRARLDFTRPVTGIANLS